MGGLIILLVVVVIGYAFLLAIFVIICPYLSYKNFSFFVKNCNLIMIPAIILSVTIYERNNLHKILDYSNKYIDDEKERYKKERKGEAVNAQAAFMKAALNARPPKTLPKAKKEKKSIFQKVFSAFGKRNRSC